MSAAEKLRELEQHAPGNHWDAEVSAALRKALPQIIAVVEAAEQNYRTQTEICLERGDPIPSWLLEDGAALAALDDALTTKGER